ncbi:antA/AntB antirepressor family protein [Halomonas sp. XH26]|uniref:antA/AntB antirepressor family protein n=1 Tax=Halomonas sp. XH26 TaxID=2557993 RepID=UPI00209FD2AE|nr:antA/AntB antirepressor family protein [Halomonas sp. XH26]UTA78948.1 antA/AntB antirepressor family protein [Halomonas sp. XH26]
MKDSSIIIAIEAATIGGEAINTVNARDLHEFLEVKAKFTTWIQSRINQYGFLEGQDFVKHEMEPGKGFKTGSQKNEALQSIAYADNFGQQGRIEYHISLDMAKELSMVERNEKGKQARQYFIECERRAKEAISSLPDFSNPVIAARAWADAKESEQKAVAQRDQAIATKAQISSSREASVMGKLSAASRKMQKLEQELGRNTTEATVTAVEKAIGQKYGKQGFRPLKKWCKDHDVTPNKVPCPRYGEVVAWPAAAWLDCYDIDLHALFGREDAA